MSVIVNAEVYDKLFPNAAEPFLQFMERARSVGATVSSTESSSLRSGLSILGFIVGLIAAGIITSLGTALHWSLGVAAAMSSAMWLFYSAEKLRRATVMTTSLKDELPWNMCQSLSLIFVGVAFSMATVHVVQTLLDCDEPHKCSQEIFGWACIVGVLLPNLILSCIVWAFSGNSPTVLSINVFLTFLVLVFTFVATLHGFSQNSEEFAKWWFFGASFVAVAESVYILAFQHRLPTHVIKRNAQFLVEVSTLVLWPTSFLISLVPFTSSWPNWIFSNAVLVLFFSVAALSDCVVPLLIVVNGVFFDVIKVYIEVSERLPKGNTAISMLFTIFYLGGCAAALIVTAPHVQPALKGLSIRIKGVGSTPLLSPDS